MSEFGQNLFGDLTFGAGAFGAGDVGLTGVGSLTATGTHTAIAAAALTGVGSLLATPDVGSVVLGTTQVGLGLEVGDRITVIETPPGFTSSRTGDYVIQHLSGQINQGPITGMKLQFLLWPATVTSFWLVGDDQQSLLGVSTRLGY